MRNSQQHRTPLAQLRNALLTDIAAAYTAGGSQKILFDEPWHIGPPLDDSWPYVAGGIEQQGELLVVLDTHHGGSYPLDKLHADDLLWVLTTVEEMNLP